MQGSIYIYIVVEVYSYMYLCMNVCMYVYVHISCLHNYLVLLYYISQRLNPPHHIYARAFSLSICPLIFLSCSSRLMMLCTEISLNESYPLLRELALVFLAVIVCAMIFLLLHGFDGPLSQELFLLGQVSLLVIAVFSLPFPLSILFLTSGTLIEWKRRLGVFMHERGPCINTYHKEEEEKKRISYIVDNKYMWQCGCARIHETYKYTLPKFTRKGPCALPRHHSICDDGACASYSSSCHVWICSLCLLRQDSQRDPNETNVQERIGMPATNFINVSIRLM